ncbi:MAG: hypothetical protein SPL13_03280 [Clostridia bacterium]|nr:hypothetical protein [Clostridia bacterium]
MKIAKPYRIVALLVTLLLSFTFAAVLMVTHVAKADGPDPKDYFSYKSRTYVQDDVVFEDDVAKVKLYTDEPFYAVNDLVFNDFSVTLVLPALSDGATFTVMLKTPSYYKTGNPMIIDGVTAYATEIENFVKFTLDGSSLKAAFNEGAEQVVDTAFDVDNLKRVTLSFKVDSDFIQASYVYDGGSSVDFPSVTDEYYKVDSNRAVVGKIYFYGATDQTFSLVNVDQKASDVDGKYKQTFELDSDNKFVVKANSVVTLSDSLTNIKSGDNVVLLGYKYNISFNKYLLTGADNTAYSLKGGDATVLADSTYVAFNEVGNKTVDIMKGDEVVETVSFKVVDRENDEDAPVYNTSDAIALESFKAYFNKLVADAIENGETSITIEKSKLYNLVSDEYSSLDTMTYVVKYWADDSNSSSSSGRIDIAQAGHYRFIILFTDQSGNAMVEEQFFYKSASDSTLELYGEYKDYIFEFDVEFDGKLSISVGTAGTGYKGVRYSSSAFTIEGKDYTSEYKLYYSATQIAEGDEGWKEIVAASDATDQDKTYGAFSYDEIKSINYDGTLAFTPDRVGYYKLECSVNSTLTANGDSKSVTFEVKEQTKTVTPDDHWLENNVWSVVFLSVGTLSLIGIIVLLFIKPKDDDSIEK